LRGAIPNNLNSNLLLSGRVLHYGTFSLLFLPESMLDDFDRTSCLHVQLAPLQLSERAWDYGNMGFTTFKTYAPNCRGGGSETLQSRSLCENGGGGGRGNQVGPSKKMAAVVARRSW